MKQRRNQKYRRIRVILPLDPGIFQVLTSSSGLDGLNGLHLLTVDFYPLLDCRTRLLRAHVDGDGASEGDLEVEFE